MGGAAHEGQEAAAQGVAALGVVVLLQVLGDESWGYLVESPGGGHAVAVLEAFEVAIGDAEVELDDAASAVGLLADYLRHGGVFLLCCCAHVFYCIRGVKGKLFTAEDAEGDSLWERETWRAVGGCYFIARG